ncbi:MAG: hypothetical protein B5M53_01650, partial [Candidatus Cloacimonas sp. 4484_209]
MRNFTSFYTKDPWGEYYLFFLLFYLRNTEKGKAFWSEKLILYNTADSKMFSGTNGVGLKTENCSWQIGIIIIYNSIIARKSRVEYS